MKKIVLALLLFFANVQGNESAFFQEHGYLILKNFYSKPQVEVLKAWANEIDRESKLLIDIAKTSGRTLQDLAKTLPQALIVVPEASDPSKACRAEDMLSCYPDLRDFIAGTISTYIGTLMNEPYVLFKDKLNFKWPGGGAFPPHQDFPAFEYFGPRIHITAMVAIDPATIENGCLQVAHNWRKTFTDNTQVDQQMLQEGKAVLPYIEGGKMHGSIQPELAQQIDWLAVEMEPGDVVLISSFVPHYSETNRSSNSRRAMLFTLNRLVEGDHRTAYYHVKRNDFDNPAFHFATPTDARTKN